MNEMSEGSATSIPIKKIEPIKKHQELGHDSHEEHRFDRIELLRIALVALAVAATWFKIWEPFANFSLIGVVGTLLGGFPIYREAFSSLAARRMTMELSMSIAIFAALAIGEAFTSLVIVLFVLIAEVLEGLTVERGRHAIKDLLDLLPRNAFVRRSGVAQEISAAELQIHDIVVVKPGARIPVDGIVVSGHSFVDQSTITGESLPAEKVAGTHVYAGTINQSGLLEVRTVNIGQDTTFGKIIHAVEQAEKSQAPIQKIADRLAGYLVYFAMGCAAFTYLVTRDIRSTISVIIVAGACGIAAGTPLAILGAIGRAARHSVIIKGGRYLEVLSRIDTVVLDKTGTLTLGNPEVIKIIPCPGVSEQSVIETAAIAERPSEHPLGKAIVKKASEMNLTVVEPERFEYLPGKGIICKIGHEEILVGHKKFLEEHSIKLTNLSMGSDHVSEVLVAREGRPLGSIQIADVLRPEAIEAVAAIRQMGLKTILLTGDSPAVAHAIGKQLKVDEIDAALLPQQKLERIQALIAEGKKVAMVGDGINDAPALMQASVGIAMGSGVDVAQETAGVVLLGNDLLKFVDTLKTARQCYRIIMTNFFGTLTVDGVGVGLAAFGFLNPLLAAFIHVSSELVFILNSARLIPSGSKQK